MTSCRVCGQVEHKLLPVDGQRWRMEFRAELERNGNCWHCGFVPGECRCVAVGLVA